jgi:hypothetical protein
MNRAVGFVASWHLAFLYYAVFLQRVIEKSTRAWYITYECTRDGDENEKLLALLSALHLHSMYFLQSAMIYNLSTLVQLQLIR